MQGREDALKAAANGRAGHTGLSHLLEGGHALELQGGLLRVLGSEFRFLAGGAATADVLGMEFPRELFVLPPGRRHCWG